MKYENLNIKINQDIKRSLGIDVQTEDIRISEKNLAKHMTKSHHENMLEYIPEVSDILDQPDYIGQNRNVKSTSFECIKVLEDNVLVAVKLDRKGDYFYVASMYEVTDAKLGRMIENGRVKKFDNL